MAVRSTDSQIFILMRSGEAEEGSDSGLDEKGLMQARKAALVVQNVADQERKSVVQLIASPLMRAWQTVQVVAKSLKIGSFQGFEPRLRDRDVTEVAKGYSPLFETNQEQFGRMQRGILRQLDAQKEVSILPVFVAHESSIHSFFEGLVSQGKLDGAAESFLPKSQHGEIFIVERRGDRFIALERKTPSPAKL